MKLQTYSARVVLACAFLISPTGPNGAHAGSGSVNDDGTIDLTVNLRFPATADILSNVEAEITRASRIIWDATEGQLAFGEVRITCTNTDEDLADVWLYAEGRRSHASLDCDATTLGRSGRHVTQYDGLGRFGAVLAHELGHLALGLHDEYPKSGDCWGANVCIEEDGTTVTERNQCLMQQAPGFSWTEFCVPSNHDLVRGDGLSCSEMPVDSCSSNCELYNHATGQYTSCRNLPIPVSTVQP